MSINHGECGSNDWNQSEWWLAVVNNASLQINALSWLNRCLSTCLMVYGWSWPTGYWCTSFHIWVLISLGNWKPFFCLVEKSASSCSSNPGDRKCCLITINAPAAAHQDAKTMFLDKLVPLFGMLTYPFAHWRGSFKCSPDIPKNRLLGSPMALC